MALSVFPQANGETGVRQTLAIMAQLANGALLDPAIRDQAAAAIAGCPKGDRRCQCYALMIWVNRKVRYVPDPRGIDTVHDPRLIARGIANRKQVYGDCDDLSTYLAALLKTIGFAPVFRAVGYDGDPFQHVYVCCEGLRLDPTRDAWSITFRPHKETSVMEHAV
jgi:hypothetical protein